MSYTSALRAYDREELKRVRRKLGRVNTLLNQALGKVYSNAPDDSPLAEVRKLLRGD